MTPSEPMSDSKPQRKSESVPPSEPGHSSEPERDRRPPCQSEPRKPSEPSRKSAATPVGDPRRERLRALVEVYYDVQDVRIRSFNRLRQVGEVKGVEPDILKELEKQVREYLRDEVHDVPVVKTFLSNVKGIGPILAGGIIAWFDPAKANHASSFWKYAGLAVEDGHAIKRVKGKKTEYNPRVKVLCWKIADSFIKSRSPFYRPLYDKAKLEEAVKLCHPEEKPENCPQYAECKARLGKAATRMNRESKKLPCKKHVDYRARRKMVKRFLADLWGIWRQLEGLPTSDPYAVAILGHSKEVAAQ